MEEEEEEESRLSYDHWRGEVVCIIILLLPLLTKHKIQLQAKWIGWDLK
jgi:hypothetical protein